MSAILEHDMGLGFWQNLLRGELGLTYLRQHIYVESWAEEKIDQGYLPVVVYSWGGAHGAALVGILEGAGYGPRALNVIAMLQLGLGPESDWGTIVTDRALMDAVFAMPTMRAMVFGNAGIMGQAAGHANARAALFANSTAHKEMWDYEVATNVALTTPAMLTAVGGHNATMDALLNNSVNWARVLGQPDNLTAIMGNENFRTRVLNNVNARLQMFNSPAAMNHLRTNTDFVNALVGNAGAWDVAVQNLTAMTSLCGHDTSWNVLWAVSGRRNNIIDSQNAMTAVGNNPARCLRAIAIDPTLRARVVSTPAARNGLAAATYTTSGNFTVMATFPRPANELIESWIISIRVGSITPANASTSIQFERLTNVANNSVTVTADGSSWHRIDGFASNEAPRIHRDSSATTVNVATRYITY